MAGRTRAPGRTRRRDPATPAWGEALARTQALLKTGRLSEARQACQTLVRRWPNRPEGWNYLGVLRYRNGEVAAGIADVRQALELASHDADAHANLGNMLLQQHRHSESEHHLRRALALDPAATAPRIALSALLRTRQQLDDSESMLLPLLERLPHNGQVQQTYANLLATRGEYEQAIEHYQRALELSPELAHTRLWIGMAFAYSGQVEKAQALFRQLLDQDPGNAQARHLLAATGGGDTPDRASDDYVRDLFDRFASGFDANLTELEYRAPQLLAELWMEVSGERIGSRVLDAGCGTGLLAPLIRGRSAVLDGVDLSSGMLSRARSRSIYDGLFEAELTAFLEGHPATYDTIFSADTLCYFGDLSAVLRATSQALHLGGWLLFSVERTPTPGPGHTLQVNGRYAHRCDHVELCLDEAGFRPVALREVVLRTESRKPVHGLIVAACRAR